MAAKSAEERAAERLAAIDARLETKRKKREKKAAEQEDEDKSLFGRARQMAGDLDDGLVGLGKSLGQTAAVVGRIPYRAVSGTHLWNGVDDELPFIAETATSVRNTAEALPYYEAAAQAALADWVGADGVAERIRKDAHASTQFGLKGIAELTGADGEEQVREIQEDPLGSIVEDVGNIALVAGGVGAVAKMPVRGVAARAAVAETQATKLVAVAKAEAATLETGASALQRAGNLAGAQARRAQAAQIVDDAAREAAKLTDDAAQMRAQLAEFKATPRGQVADVAGRVSGAANRLDPTDAAIRGIVKAPGVAGRLAEKGAMRAARAIGQEDAVVAAGAKVRAVAGNARTAMTDRATIAMNRAMAKREQVAAERGILAAARRGQKAVPSEELQSAANIVAVGSAQTFLLAPNLQAVVKAIDEGDPNAQRFIDAHYLAEKSPAAQIPSVAEMKLALDHERGILDAETSATINAGLEAYREISALREPGYRSGKGESVAPTAEELARRVSEDIEGTGPRQSVIDAGSKRHVAHYEKTRSAGAAARAAAAKAATEFEAKYGPVTGARDIADAARKAPIEAALAARRIMAEDPARAAEAMGRSGKNVTETSLGDAILAGLSKRSRGGKVTNPTLAGILDELDVKAAPASSTYPMRSQERAAAQGASARAEARYERTGATRDRNAADRRVETAQQGGKGPDGVTDGVVAFAERRRAAADHKSKRADLLEAFAPDPASMRGKAMAEMLGRAAKDAAEMQKQLSVIEAISRQATKLTLDEARAFRAMNAQIDKVTRSIAAAPPRYHQALLGAQRVSRDAQKNVTAARRSFAEDVIANDPEFAQALAGNAEVSVRAIQTALTRAQTTLREGKDVRPEFQRALTEIDARNPHLYVDAQIVAESSINLQALIDAGVDPVILTGGYIRRAEGDGNRRVVASGKYGDRKADLAQQHQKTAGVGGRTISQVVELQLKQTKQGIQNTTGDRILAEVGLHVSDGIEQLNTHGPIDIADKSGRVIRTVTADDLGKLSGEALVEAMDALEFVALDPRQADFRAIPRNVTQDTIFVRKSVANEFGRTFKDAGKIEEFFQKYADPLTRGWKALTLALAPAWHVANIVGNAMLLTLGGGVNPWDAIKFTKRAVQLREDIIAGRIVDPGASMAMEDGFHAQERQAALNGDLEDPGGSAAFDAVAHPVQSTKRIPGAVYRGAKRAGGVAAHPVRSSKAVGNAAAHPVQSTKRAASATGRVVDASYAFNQAVDDIGRLALYLERTEKRGFSPEKAVADSLKVFGSYETMTPFQRQVLRRAVPFFAWTRTITKVSLRLPLEHPVRTAWLAAISDRYGDDSDLDFMRYMSPYGGLIEDGGSMTPRGLLRGVHPGVKLGYTAVTGQRLEGGGEFGSGMYLPPGHDFSDSRWAVLREDLFGVTRVTRAIRNADGVKRYSDGNPKLRGGSYQRREQVETPLGALPFAAEEAIRYAGVPLARPKSAASEAAGRKYDRADEKAKRKYERRRANSD